MPELESLDVRAADGAVSIMRRFAGSATGPTLLVAPALGVSASYYDPFATALAERGLDVFIIEHRGTGTSRVDPRKNDWGYLTMLEHDFTAAVEAVRARRPDVKPTLLGHSLGGQLGALFESANPGSFETIVLVASCSVHFRGWPLREQPRIFVSTQAAGLLGRVLGHFPGDKVGFGGKQPTSVMRDWSRQARTGVYEPKGARIDYEAALRDVRVPVLAISIEGDTMAPPAAVDRLLAKMPRAASTHERSKPDFPVKTTQDPHFKWARNGGAIADRVARFVTTKA